MLAFLAVLAVAATTGHRPAAGIALVAITAAVLAGLIIAARRRDTPGRADAGGLDDILDGADSGPVEHHGADEQWSPDAWAQPAGDPLTRDLSEIELRDALLFDEIAAAYPVRLDWAPPTASQEWALAGARLAELGDTAPLEAIPA